MSEAEVRTATSEEEGGEAAALISILTHDEGTLTPSAPPARPAEDQHDGAG